MTHATKKPGGWSAVRPHLSTWDKSALLELVKDLYETAEENRDFIQARCQADESGGDVLEKYRSKIVEQFFPARGHGKLKLGAARKTIRDYRKATGNLPGTAELLMTYVENGARFTHEYGDIDLNQDHFKADFRFRSRDKVERVAMSRRRRSSS